MSNNKQQTAVEQFSIALYERGLLTGNGDEIQELLEMFKEIEKERINNLPIHIHEGISNTLVYIEYGIVHVKRNNETYGGNK